jgi:hypothetical protein
MISRRMPRPEAPDTLESVARRSRALALAGLPLCLAVLMVSTLASSRALAGVGHRSRCLPRGARTVTSDRSARVYSVAGASSGPERTYACLFADGRTTVLGGSDGALPHSLSHISLAGTLLAYADYRFGVDSGCTGITVLDLARSRTLLTLSQVGCTIDAGFVSLGQVTDLVLSSHGSVAWIVSKGKFQAATYAVHRAETSGSTTLLDEGPAIVPGSLRLLRGVVSWQDGGHPVSANLP